MVIQITCVSMVFVKMVGHACLQIPGKGTNVNAWIPMKATSANFKVRKLKIHTDCRDAMRPDSRIIKISRAAYATKRRDLTVHTATRSDSSHCYNSLPTTIFVYV